MVPPTEPVGCQMARGRPVPPHQRRGPAQLRGGDAEIHAADGRFGSALEAGRDRLVGPGRRRRAVPGLIDVHPVVARQAFETVGPPLSDCSQAPVAVAEVDLAPDERTDAGRVCGAESEIVRASGLA